jgi:hypothetical protein
VRQFEGPYPEMCGKIRDALNDLQGDHGQTAFEQLEALAREAIPLAEKKYMCASGRRIFNQARAIIGLYVVTTQVAMIIRLKDVRLPQGVYCPANAGFTVDVKDRDGKIIASLPLNEEMEDEDDDDDFEDDDDDFEDDDDDFEDEDDF